MSLKWRGDEERSGSASRAKMILPKEMGHGDMENAARFPHLHTPYYDHGLGSKKALH